MKHHMTSDGPIPFTAEEEIEWENWEKNAKIRAAEHARTDRNVKLTISDWTQLPDAPVDKQAWAEYRQALRDIPQQAGFPNEINWPEEPQ